MNIYYFGDIGDFREAALDAGKKYIVIRKDLKFDKRLAEVILEFLSQWELGLVYEDYNRTLEDIGNLKDRKKIIKIVGDLRVPFYRQDIFFVRGSRAIKFMKTFFSKREKYSDRRFTIIEALWEIKPYYLTLPNEIVL